MKKYLYAVRTKWLNEKTQRYCSHTTGWHETVDEAWKEADKFIDKHKNEMLEYGSGVLHKEVSVCQ